MRPWAAAAGVAFVVLSIELRGALCAVRFLAQRTPPIRAVQEPQHRRDQPLVFPGHPDRRPAAAAVLSAASHRRLRDRPDRPARDARSGRAPVDAAAFAVSGVCLGLSIAISSFAGLMVTAGGDALRRRGGAPRVRLAARPSSTRSPRRFRWRVATGARLRRLRYVDSSGVGRRARPSTAWRVHRFLVGHVAQLRAGADLCAALAIPVLRERARAASASSARSR